MISLSAALIFFAWVKSNTKQEFPLGMFWVLAVLADIAIVWIIFGG